jgi:toxin ParE1/3/4
VIVVLTAEAETDLESIAEYIARTRRRDARLSAGAALRTSRHPQASVRPLSDFLPRRTDAIEVLHILHGARDYEPSLFPEP